jgi:hypothetical protein
VWRQPIEELFPHGFEMKKAVLIGACLGFLGPIVLGAEMVFLFDAPDSRWVHFVYYQLPYIVCPTWILFHGSSFWFVAMPLVNALTYGAIAFLIANARLRRNMGLHRRKIGSY